MSYYADVWKVMIASPKDVLAERQAIRDAINDWNAANSEQDDYSSIVLLPVSSETHATPEMGDRPQAILNRQILKDCDILVAVFWTRLGTPTGVAPSGTVEEIQKHIAAGKHAMIYFSNAPVSPNAIDSEQYRALTDFRHECFAKGLCDSYESVPEFRTKFTRHLAKIMNAHLREGRAVSRQMDEEIAAAGPLSEPDSLWEDDTEDGDDT
jgi:hypothetical protein